ncbi:hypothetical protein J3R30DRAFT_3504558 [Lentinula aciculospora]|uniref:RRM domain-containing protein n=1 Tax=Lentinula aciculospora TaxID=153920 RepID=A0A9W9A6V1_9AGAR|nr:hypothetical protein J3R30DRAFT_3504558 [Lentinula aciculospora]
MEDLKTRRNCSHPSRVLPTDSRQIAFITYCDSSAAQITFKKMQGLDINGSIIDIQFDPLSWTSEDINITPPATLYRTSTVCYRQAMQNKFSGEQLLQTLNTTYNLSRGSLVSDPISGSELQATAKDRRGSSKNTAGMLQNHAALTLTRIHPMKIDAFRYS